MGKAIQINCLVKDAIQTEVNQRKGYGTKVKKTRKGWSQDKVVGFSSASIFSGRKWEAITQGGTKGLDEPTRRITQRAGIIKGWEDNRDRERIPDSFT